jgi:hypothetical protein
LVEGFKRPLFPLPATPYFTHNTKMADIMDDIQEELAVKEKTSFQHTPQTTNTTASPLPFNIPRGGIIVKKFYTEVSIYPDGKVFVSNRPILNKGDEVRYRQKKGKKQVMEKVTVKATEEI